MGRSVAYFYLSLLMLMGCASSHPPSTVTYVRADAALKHARRHQADQFGHKNFRRALRYFDRGRDEYRKQYYSDAEASLQMATQLAKLAMRKAFVVKGLEQSGASVPEEVEMPEEIKEIESL